MDEKKSGSCLCGEVKFEVSGDFDGFFLCHCKFCQKDTGSAHAANAFSSKAQLNWISGKSQVKTFHLKETRHQKSFCANCGSALPSIQMDGRIVVVPVGSFDSDFSMKPTAHIFMKSKASWDRDLNQIPMIDGLPT